MGKLYGWLIVLEIVLTGSLALASWSVYAVAWPQGAAAAVVFLIFVAGTGAVIPGTLRSLSGPRLKTARALVQAFGAWSTGEILTMALVTWILGKRYVPHDNAYDTLGLLIFLGLMGVGAMGAIGAVFRFLAVRNRELVIPRLRSVAQQRAAHTAQLEGTHAH